MDEKQIGSFNEKYEALIKGCVEQNRAAQNELYKLFSSQLFAVCYRYSNSREEAEDTFHEGFMKIFDNIKNFRNEGPLEGWLRRIMVNTALKKFKKKSLEIVNIDDVAEVENKSNQYYSDDFVGQSEANKIMKLIDNLPPAYKLVFNLYEFEGLKHHEIATQLGISEGTSKSNLSRAKTILQNAIKEEEIKSAQKLNYSGSK